MEKELTQTRQELDNEREHSRTNLQQTGDEADRRVKTLKWDVEMLQKVIFSP
jgi:hypothetical protein